MPVGQQGEHGAETMEHWKLIMVVGLGLAGAYFLLSWFGRPTRHRDQHFADLPRFLGYWAEAMDRGGRIFIEPEQPGVPRLGFRLVGRGERKTLRVTIPRGRSSEGELRAKLESLASRFEQVDLREKPRSMELRLPAADPYTASVAARAAEAALLSLGCTNESTFTVYGSSGAFDPYYELRIAEQAADSAGGVIKRWFEKRAARIRSELPKRRGVVDLAADTNQLGVPTPGSLLAIDSCGLYQSAGRCGPSLRDFNVRSAVPSDLDAIASVDDVAQSEVARLAFIERSLRSATCLVAERERRVVAYAVLEYSFFDNGFVSMLHVAEPQRRQGIGRALLEALADRCETPKLFTSTNQSNQPMQQLLSRLGYVPSGVVENLDPGDPELFYFLDLSSRRLTRQRG